MSKINRFDRLLPRLVFAALLSFPVLAVCSKSSFLYPMNDWTDVNCFFTVGRGIVHGLMPYRDLYEQKGPLLYLLYALASLVSEHSYLGVYLLESLGFTFFLHLSGRIAETAADTRAVYWPTAALIALAVPVSGAFSSGSGAEGFILPALALGLWLVLRAMRGGRALGDGEGFVLGLCTAVALWIKYTFCGLFAGLALAVMIWYLATGRAGQLLRLIGFFLLGLLALSAGIVGWFALRGALGDLWQVYFIDNITKYPQAVGLRKLASLPLTILRENPSWMIPAALGLVWTAVRVRKHRWEALAVWLSAAVLFAFTYFGGRSYPYYALVLAVYAPLGLTAAGLGVRRLARRYFPGTAEGGKLTLAAAAAALVLLLANPFAALRLGTNTYLLGTPMAETPYGQFAQIIRQSDDRSLLNYGFLDSGFYYAAGVQPDERYFCMLNINSGEMRAAQEASVAEKRPAFVVVRRRSADGKTREKNVWEEQMADSGDYRLVEQADWRNAAWHYVYSLYRRRDAGDS